MTYLMRMRETAKDLDLIHIDDLIVRGRHGVGQEERSSPQDFKVKIVLGVDVAAAGRSDDLGDTINYQEVKDTIEAIVQQESYALIERLADRIWESIRQDARIYFAKISIKKLQIWPNGVPGVTVFRGSTTWPAERGVLG